MALMQISEPGMSPEPHQARLAVGIDLSTTGMPLRTVATSELVVPRSMPTASRCSWGAGDMPGSEIWRSAIRLCRYSTCS